MANGRWLATTVCAVRAGVVLAVTLGTAATAAGQIRLLVPEDSPGGPFYARIHAEDVYRTDEWVAIAFYREPGCVPTDFNLLDFYDFAGIPAIFGCPLTVHGFELWADSDTPKQSRLRGNGAVPVWFVSVAEFDAAVLDGVLTVPELLTMDSLMQGVATRFEETLHPFAGQGTQLRLIASGILPDGRAFRYLAVEANGVVQHVGIDVR
jgi:hypothetical protein